MAKLITPSMVEQFKKIYSDASSGYNLSDAEIEQSLNLAYGTGNWYYGDSTGSNSSSSQTDTKNSDIVNNMKDKVTNEDTINGVETEEQEPTQETSKEGSTINLDPSEKGEDVKITELPNTQTFNPDGTVNKTKDTNESKKDTSEAYNKYIEMLSNSIGKDKLDVIKRSGQKLTQENVDDFIKSMGYENIDDASADLETLFKYYENNNFDVDEASIDNYFKEHPEAQLSRSVIPMLKPFFQMFKGIGNALGKASTAFFASKVGQWLIKLGPLYWASAALGDIDIGKSVYDNLRGYDSERKTLDKNGNTLPYWKQALWGLLYGVDKTLLQGLPSTIIEMAGGDTPRENTQAQQKKAKQDKAAIETFKTSNTYQGTKALDKIKKKYGTEEEQLASKLMTNAIAIINNYNLAGEPYNQEKFYAGFEYDPTTHNRYDKDSGFTLFDLIEALSNQEALATQNNTNGK